MASGTKATRLTLDGHSLVVISCSTRAKGSPTRDDAALWSDILWSSIDTLLLSHSSLPLLHQLFLGTLRGFTGTVLAPEPLLSYWALDTLESGDMSQRDVKRALRMCKCVGFYQELSLDLGLSVTPVPSGTGLGECHWVVSFHGQTLVYMGPLASHLPSTPLSRHFNHEYFKGASVLLDSGCGVSRSPEVNAGQAETLKSLIYQNLEARAHCVLPIPLFSAPGFVPLLCQWARGAGTQVHFLAACATQSLKYADLLSEWMNESRQALVHSGSSPTEYTSLVPAEVLFIHESLPSLLAHFRGPFGGMGTVSRPSLVLCSEGFVEEVVQVLVGRVAILWLDPSRLPSDSLQTLISTRPVDSTRLLNFAETAASSEPINQRSIDVSEIARLAGISCITSDDKTAEQSLLDSVKSLRGSATGVSGVAHPSFTRPDDANGNVNGTATSSSTSQPIHGSLCLSSFTVR